MNRHFAAFLRRDPRIKLLYISAEPVLTVVVCACASGWTSDHQLAAGTELESAGGAKIDTNNSGPLWICR